METHDLSALLLPELESELAKVRRIFEALPDGHNDFKPHEKSMNLGRLAGHTAELASFITMILSSPDVNLAAGGRTPVLMETKQQVIAEFNERADKTITTLKHTSDETFNQHWKLSRKEHQIFSGTRYNAYRSFGLNHLIHHRGQLGVYLRLLDHPVPGTFGPSADGI